MKYIYRKEAGYWIFFNKLKIKITNKRRNALAGYMFISIWLIGFIVLAAYPLIRSLIFSFQKVTISGAQGILTVGVGFNNYLTIFTQDLEFLRMIQEFVFEMILYVPIILTIAMIIAMMLNQKIKLRGFFRAIYFLPVVIASGPVINELLNQGAGSVPIIEDLGMLEVLSGFLPMVIARPLSSFFSEMIMILWFSGVQIVLFLAGLQKLSKEIYEAAEIDGASPWEKFWKITLPSLKSIIFVSAIYTIVMLATFSNNEIITYIQSSGVMFSSDKGYGYASTLAWIYFIVIVVLLVITALVLGNKREKKEKR